MPHPAPTPCSHPPLLPPSCCQPLLPPHVVTTFCHSLCHTPAATPCYYNPMLRPHPATPCCHPPAATHTQAEGEAGEAGGSVHGGDGRNRAGDGGGSAAVVAAAMEAAAKTARQRRWRLLFRGRPLAWAVAVAPDSRRNDRQTR